MAVLPNFPTVRPTRIFDFRKSKALPSGNTFYRDSTATYIDNDGGIKTAGKGVPRFTHNFKTGECLGLLLEPTSTNQYINSYELRASPWEPRICTLSATTIKTPLGTNSTRMIADKTTSGSGEQFKEIVISGVAWPAKVNYSYSLLIKKDTHKNIQLHGRPVLFGDAYVNVDIETGEIGTSSLGWGERVGVEVRNDGWCLIKISGTSINTTTESSGYITFSLQKNLTQGRGQYWDSDGTESVLIGYVQLEFGLGEPTSYIPTTTTAVTRAADGGFEIPLKGDKSFSMLLTNNIKPTIEHAFITGVYDINSTDKVQLYNSTYKPNDFFIFETYVGKQYTSDTNVTMNDTKKKVGIGISYDTVNMISNAVVRDKTLRVELRPMNATNILLPLVVRNSVTIASINTYSRVLSETELRTITSTTE